MKTFPKDITSLKEINIPSTKIKLIVGITPTDCWYPLYRSFDKEGYARIQYKGVDTRVHRVTYTLFKGIIPKDKIACHQCANPFCCNPEHIRLGTAQDNANDREADGNTCRGERNARAVLTEIQVEDILLSEDKTISDLAQKYKVSWTTIKRIRIGKTWSHVFKRIKDNLNEEHHSNLYIYEYGKVS